MCFQGTNWPRPRCDENFRPSSVRYGRLAVLGAGGGVFGPAGCRGVFGLGADPELLNRFSRSVCVVACRCLHLALVWRTFCVVLMLLLWLACGVYALRGLAVGTELISHMLVSDGGVSYLAIERGGFGSTWNDVVERQSVAFLFFRQRNLQQYQRESVAKLSLLPSVGLVVVLDEYGKPPREEVIKVPGY